MFIRSCNPHRCFLLSVVLAALTTPAHLATAADYAIVVSAPTHARAEWADVVKALQSRYDAKIIAYESDVNESLAPLKACFPRHTCFVATSAEADRAFVRKVHQLTRQLDDDPYTDTLWGILTGWNAKDALRIARHKTPLRVQRVASGTEFAMDMVEQGVWYSELQQHHMVEKQPGESATVQRGPADTTRALVDEINKNQPDLIITSGHATEREWQIGFRYRNGSFRSQGGKLAGHDTQGNVYPIQSNHPSVYLPIGNCLMGNIDGPDAMALAWMHSAGVHQMIGYTVPTWFGYAGWGCLDYFVEQPGRYTFAEAFHANQHALNHLLTSDAAEVNPLKKGLTFDRDVVALYGDPAWDARMEDRPKAYEQTLTESDGLFTLTITGNRKEKSFQPINRNGSQRGWRPFVAYLPYRITNPRIIEGEALRPVIMDDFILVPNPRTCQPDKPYVIRFRAGRKSVAQTPAT